MSSSTRALSYAVLEFPHFGDVQDFLASGAKGEPAKDGRPLSRGLRISGGLGGSTGYQESLHIRKMGSLDRP